jgi:hypothetical protein
LQEKAYLLQLRCPCIFLGSHLAVLTDFEEGALLDTGQLEEAPYAAAHYEHRFLQNNIEDNCAQSNSLDAEPNTGQRQQ